MQNIRSIIFDFDWVIHNSLYDLHKIHCQTLGQISLEQMIKNVFSWNARKYFEKFTPKQKLNFETKRAEYHKNIDINPKIKDYLCKLQKKYELFIVSSNNEYNLKNFFQKWWCINIFKDILWAETSYSKVDKFNLIFNKYNLTNLNTVFVTDTLWDLLEAKKLKIPTIAVEFWFMPKEMLIQWKPDQIISDFADLENSIENLESMIWNKIKNWTLL